MIQIMRAVRDEVSRLPLLTRIGLALMPVALVVDLFVHAAPVAHHHHVGFAAQDHIGHLIGILAMVLVITGVVVDGARRHRSQRRSPHAAR